MDVLELARASLTRAEDFAYYGDLYEDDGWGWAFGIHRDSDVLAQSNWAVICETMESNFPDDWAVERSSHFLVGWTDEGRVKALRDPEQGITWDNLTDAFLKVAELKDRLDDYPILDEGAFSELESAEFEEDIETWILPDIRNYLSDTYDLSDVVSEDVAQMALEQLCEYCCRSDDVGYSDIENACEDAFSNFCDQWAAEYAPSNDQFAMEV